MASNIKNIFNNVEINILASQMCEVLKTACETFWEKEFSIILQGINDFSEIRKEKIISNIDFFSSQIKVEKHNPILIRLSEEFVGETLKMTLQTNYPEFNFKQLTQLEIKILNGFCDFIYKKLKDILIDVPISEKSTKYVNFIFLLKNISEDCSKIMISIPQDRLNLQSLTPKPAFKDEDFLASSTLVNIKAGSSKITLDELKNLTKEDIILLENSKLDRMTLISGKVENDFNIKINSSLILELDDVEDDDINMQINNEVIMEKNLWDDIQIEVNAEFEKVKMTIGELKQITQGQIVDLGSVFENEISLFVEDRKVATGELIIINDRYAVRLNEILNTNAKKAPIKAQIEAEPKSQAAPKQVPPPQKAQPKMKEQAIPPRKPMPQPAVEDEEFDYSDFEK